MEVVKANELARSVARYIRHNPRPMKLEERVRHITHGQGLDEGDIQQVTRKVNRLLIDGGAWPRRERVSKQP